jgi:hypothetical protein
MDEMGRACSLNWGEEDSIYVIWDCHKERGFGRRIHGWVNNIKMGLGEIELGCCGQN